MPRARTHTLRGNVYSIDLDLLDGKTPVENLHNWITYEDAARGLSFDLCVRYVHPDEQAEWVKLTKGRDATDEEWRWWSGHAVDWAGIVAKDGVTQVPFTAERMARLWDLDGAFRLWFIREAQRFDNFRCPSVTAQAA